MKIVLSTSPHVRHPAALQSDLTPDPRVVYSFAPVGLLSLAAVLRDEGRGFDRELYDLNRRIQVGALPLDRSFYRATAADICAHSPDVVGFMTECDSYHHVLQIAAEIRRRSPKTRVVLGGPHASVVARATLERYEAIDAIVIGEGERTFVDVLDAFEDEDVDRAVPGALVRASGMRRDGDHLFDGGPRPLIASLDELPVPAYEIYAADPGEEIFLEVGRGCPFQCTFCSTAPYWNRRHRVKSPERILKEITLVRQFFGTTRAHFIHDLFTTDRRWVRAVCETLISAGAPIRWTCSARTDTVDRELLELMARAGCDAIYFGIESGSERVLKEVHKAIPLARSFSMLAVCRDAGITPNAGFIVGFPYDDAESVAETFAAYERALRLGVRPAHIFAFCPFAGSSIYPQLDELACTGHFVDLPLGAELDSENRRRIASDRDLHGAYFRVPLPDAVAGEPDMIFAVDEFSPLIEAALWPSLRLAQLCGGMGEVFRRWLTYVHAHNDARGAPPYRRGYGSPALFARFLAEQLVALDAPPDALEGARAIELNLRVIERISLSTGTSMATYRSVALPPSPSPDGITVSMTVAASGVLATFESAFDVTPALAGAPGVPLEPLTTRLIWQLTGNGVVRLLRVDRAVLAVVARLGERAMSVADLVLESAQIDASGADIAAYLTPDELVRALRDAAHEGLVRS